MIDYVRVVRKNPINPSAPKKTYAQAQSRQTLNINDLAAHMAAHGCPFSRGTIKAVLEDAIKCTQELLLDGNIVSLGELGKFSVALRSKGVCESIVDNLTGEKPVFTANDITVVKINWQPTGEMKNLRSEATFNEVSTRKVQATNLKTKHGQIADGTYVGDNPKKPGVSEID